VVNYLLVEVAVICELHDQTERGAGVLKESFFIGDDVWMTKFELQASYFIEARILTSFKAFDFSFSDNAPIFT